MKKILAHVSYTNKNYISIIKYLVQHSTDSLQTIAASLHGNVFDASEETGCDYLFLSIEEYTQEFHDFVNDTNKMVFLFVDKVFPNDVISYLSSKNNVRFIAASGTDMLPPEKTLFYEHLYDGEIFSNNNSERNDKIAILLSRFQEKNELLKECLYPISELPIVCFNNPSFDHPQNVGILSDVDTNYILNKCCAVVDIDGGYLVESKACECPYIKVDGSLKDNIKDMVTIQCSVDLSTSTFSYFSTQILIPYILGA
jgi:hypothetical protein